MLSAEKTLRIGDRVLDKKYRRGVVTFRFPRGAQWRYMVRWQGNKHESGEYGIRNLRKAR